MTSANDPFGRGQAPRSATREGRIELLVEAASALAQGRLPSREACIFLADGLMGYLVDGRSIAQFHWRVTKRRSRATVPVLAAKSISSTAKSDKARECCDDAGKDLEK